MNLKNRKWHKTGPEGKTAFAARVLSGNAEMRANTRKPTRRTICAWVNSVRAGSVPHPNFLAVTPFPHSLPMAVQDRTWSAGPRHKT